MTYELWRQVPGWPQYEVSSIGRVRSVDRLISDSLGRIRTQYGRLKKTWIDDGGYRRVELSDAGNRSGIGVHRLVAMAFIGMPKEGQETRHLDGDSLNNCVDNLAWGTHLENVRDTVRMGRHASRNTKKTHCPRNHPYSDRNSRGDRVCRECTRRRDRESYARRTKEVAK
jgi:hypothetical protein